jgi:hypothetical protein
LLPGGNIAQPQALLAIVSHHVQQVFAVGRNGNQRGFASFRDFADGKF